MSRISKILSPWIERNNGGGNYWRFQIDDNVNGELRGLFVFKSNATNFWCIFTTIFGNRTPEKLFDSTSKLNAQIWADDWAVSNGYEFVDMETFQKYQLLRDS